MTTSYNPFHHLTILRYPDWEGDPFVRLALIELIKQNNLTFTGPYASALESTSFGAQLMLAVYDELYPDGMNEDWEDQASAGHVGERIIRKVRSHLSTEAEANIGWWVPDLALADQRAILAAVENAWSEDEKDAFTSYPENWTAKARESAERPANALSAHFTVKPFGTAIVGMIEGGNDPIPARNRFLSRMSGPYHMTWKACQEWGFRIPKTPGFPDTNDVLINVTFNKPPKDVYLRIVSSTDDVPDPDKPGEMKSEGHTVELTKGKNRNQLALTSHDLKYHDWVFSARDDRSKE